MGIELIIVNSGFRDRGFYICPDCGRAEIQDPIRLLSDHHRPYAINIPRNSTPEEKKEANSLCGATPLGDLDQGEGILLGAKFRSDLLSFRFKIEKPLERGKHLVVNHNFNGGLRAIKEALITEVQEEMKYVNREIGGGIRKFAQKSQKGNKKRVEYFVDIFLYDQVSGGAGLVTQLADNLDLIPRIFNSVERRLSGEKCTSGKPCDRACVGCLLDFRNKREHSSLDRVYGRRILKWLKDGQPPTDDYLSLEEDNNHSRGIARIADSMQRTAGGELDFRIVSPDGQHSVIEVCSPGSNDTIRIRPVSSITRPRKDPIVSEDREFQNEISISGSQIPDSGWIRFTDLERGYVPLVKILREAIGETAVFG
jgi:hypothetical protein